MPLIVEVGRVPPRWLLEQNGRSRSCVPEVFDVTEGARDLNIALINNMPDSALEDTELQFFDLLDDASGDCRVHLKLYSLAGIPRTDRGQNHLNSFYSSLDELWRRPFDGVIITGTEPRQPNLREEPYWGALSDVFDWAERSVPSTILSCLAAHASVLQSDGIGRHQLPDKQFGVFESERTCDHVLMNRVADRLRFPHSRWNEVREEELIDAGYIVVTKSADAGVDTFLKMKKNSLFLHFQGHPEYGVQTLFKEYRRDIKRFLNHERETYPSMPVGYFDVSKTYILGEFQRTAMSDRRDQVMALFPEEAIIGGPQNGWHAIAVRVYHNWLQYLLARRTEASVFAPVTAAYSG